MGEASQGSSSGRKRLTRAGRRVVIERVATEVFAEFGYHKAGVNEIARRAGVSIPVVYDHFASKLQLYRALLEQHFAELRALWDQQLARELPAERRIATALDAWFGYVQTHPFAWRMLFADPTGEPELQDIHRQVADASRAAMLPTVAAELVAPVPDIDGEQALAMAWEVVRAGLQALALWWHQHQDVPREHLVAMAMNTLWVGFQRLRDGQHWEPDRRDEPASPGF